jgi:hypothetical protein
MAAAITKAKRLEQEQKANRYSTGNKTAAKTRKTAALI